MKWEWVDEEYGHFLARGNYPRDQLPAETHIIQ